jgi:hypothetical protein
MGGRGGWKQRCFLLATLVLCSWQLHADDPNEKYLPTQWSKGIATFYGGAPDGMVSLSLGASRPFSRGRSGTVCRFYCVRDPLYALMPFFQESLIASTLYLWPGSISAQLRDECCKSSLLLIKSLNDGKRNLLHEATILILLMKDSLICRGAGAGLLWIRHDRQEQISLLECCRTIHSKSILQTRPCARLRVSRRMVKWFYVCTHDSMTWPGQKVQPLR